MRKLSVLVVEDDALSRKVLAHQLQDHQLDFAHDFPGALEKIKEGKHDLCFIDLKLGEKDDASGLKLIPLAAAKGMYSVVMSGHDSEPIVEQAYSLGCNDFYAKGNEAANVKTLVAKFLQQKNSNGQDIFGDRYITEDPITRSSIDQALKYAASELPVLILGPSGTGKTSLAALIHEYSGRSGEFVSINCAAYTEELLEAELFGYRKGSFTGASDARRGKLLAADQGTLFLDEIGSMSLKMQTKLLKAIEEKTFYPIGSDQPESSNFRIISATLENLQGLIKAGQLRFDFFQRIHGLTIELKPLSERICDILPLIHFFTRNSKRLSFAPEAKELLLNYDWPGNIRELKKFVDLLAAGGEGRVTLQAVQKLLASIRVTDKNEASDIVTETQYRLALREGLQKTLDLITDEIIKRNLTANTGRKTQVLEDLKISTRLLYASLRRDSTQELGEDK